MSGAVATESLRRITRWGLGSGAASSGPPCAAAAPTPVRATGWRNSRDARLVEQGMSDPLRPTRTRGARTRRFPWWLLLVAFVVVPLVEIYVIVQIGQVIGAWWTILLLVADSLLGSWLVKREGGRAWEALRVALQQGRMPHKELADGMLVLIGGLLMLTPGFVLDVVGLLAILR